MSSMTIHWLNRSWDYIRNGPKTSHGPIKKDHQDFINERSPNFAMKATPAQTFSLGGTLLFGLGWLFSLKSDSSFAKWTTGVLATVGVITTTITGLAMGWKIESANAVDTQNKNGNTEAAERTDSKDNSSKPQKIFSEEDFYKRLDYSDVTGEDLDISTNGKKYARALAKAGNNIGIDEINKVAKDLKSRFNVLMNSMGKTPSEFGKSES